jgi:REP element-mobilizing transposase RayT
MTNKPASRGNHSRGYLPHLVRPGAFYFVTFRLADSLPREVLFKIERELNDVQIDLPSSSPTTPQYDRESERRKRIERYLDSGAGSCCLADPRIANLAAEILHSFHEQDYLLDEWVIMPNHVHALVQPRDYSNLSVIVQHWKGNIARQANLILGKTGTRFWQPEAFDRIIRHEEEKQRVRRYIRNNPVKANLCQFPESWPWSSAAHQNHRV